MTDDEVLREAAFDGFELEERACQDAWAWGWCRGDDRRWPCYLEQRQAVNWMHEAEPRPGIRVGGTRLRRRLCRMQIGSSALFALDVPERS